MRHEHDFAMHIWSTSGAISPLRVPVTVTIIVIIIVFLLLLLLLLIRCLYQYCVNNIQELKTARQA